MKDKFEIRKPEKDLMRRIIFNTDMIREIGVAIFIQLLVVIGLIFWIGVIK